MVRPRGDAKVTKSLAQEQRCHTITPGWLVRFYPGPDREALWAGPGEPPAAHCQPEPGALLILALFLSGRFRLALFCAAPSPYQKGDCPSNGIQRLVPSSDGGDDFVGVCVHVNGTVRRWSRRGSG